MPAFMDNEPRKKKGKSNAFKAFEERRGQFDDTLLFTPEQVDVIKFVIQEGHAIRFGLTKDGGALNIAVYSDGEVKNAYMRSADEINEFFAVLYSFAKGSVD